MTRGAAPIALAVIGAGNWGSKLVRVLKDCDGVDLRYVVDPDPDARKRAAEIAPDVKTEQDVSNVLQHVGAIAVCTPANDHFDHVMKALELGKDVFVEKPFAMGARDALALKEISESANSILMVGHQLLYHPVFKKLRSMVKEGHLGRILSIHAERTGPVDLNREPGVLWSYGPHDVAMVVALAREEPSHVNATGSMSPDLPDTPQCADVELTFARGLVSSIHLSTVEARKRRLTVIGDRLTAVFDDSIPGGSLTVQGPKDSEPKAVSVEKGEPLALEIEHFAKSLKDRTVPMTGPGHATIVTRVLEEAHASLAEKFNTHQAPCKSINQSQ